MRRWTILLGLALCAGCSTYKSAGEQCHNQAECNPGKTCGDMIQCVDGRCDAAVLITLPCDEGCSANADCPAGMHCRLTGVEGKCVADGTCADASECLGLDHDDCSGAFACLDGVCTWRCEDFGACAADGDCVLADKDCCCGSTPDDYVAVAADKLSDWRNRDECQGINCPEIACQVPGSIEAVCRSGQCAVTQKGDADLFACARDADCVPMPDGCCACFDGHVGFVGVRADKLSEWYQSLDCGDIQCEQCFYNPGQANPVCWGDGCVEAHCQLEAGGQGTCRASLRDPDACTTDGDCAKAPIACPSCDCQAGYREDALNADLLEAALDFMDRMCSVMGACMVGPFGTDACTDRPAVCREGRCDVLGQSCDCADIWEPVCVLAPNDGLQTFPNLCQAVCAWGDEVVATPGRCECQVDCDCYDEYGCEACASDGQTYGCSYWEITCNGLDPLYPGACDAGCAFCAELDRMPLPVCGGDFFDYADLCYSECLGRPYWHQGTCLPNEGATCGQGPGVPCPSEDLYCWVDEMSPSGIGHCIQLGACIEARHCENQPLDTPNCVGHWTCPDHACAYVCD